MNKYTGRYDAQLRVKPNEDGTDSRVIEGYAIVFGQESLPLWQERGLPAYEVISREAVTDELLNGSDIKMTMYHDNGRLLARKKKGGDGSNLECEIDDHGVKFSFEAPNTAYGNEALELVKRGVIDGCSFMFTTNYSDEKSVSRTVGKEKVVYTVRAIGAIFDFTLTPDPAYPQTECEARSAEAASANKDADEYRSQVADMRNEIDEISNSITF